MYTVITETTLKPGKEAEWDHAFQERVKSVSQQPGWMGVDLLTPDGDQTKRVVIGNWRSQEDWDHWHASDAFKQSRSQLGEATADDGEPRWYEVTLCQGHRDMPA